MFLLLLWRPAVDDVHSAYALDNNNTEEWTVDYSFLFVIDEKMQKLQPVCFSILKNAA